MLRSALRNSLKNPAAQFQRTNIAFSPCYHFSTTQTCRATRKKAVDLDTPPEMPSPPPPKRTRRRKLEDISADKINLPDPLDWRTIFPPGKLGKERISVSNPDTAAAIAEAFVPEGSKDKVVIEAFPGEKC